MNYGLHLFCPYPVLTYIVFACRDPLVHLLGVTEHLQNKLSEGIGKRRKRSYSR
jgi:hypothetical protein